MSRIPQRNITQGFIVIDVMSVHDRPQTELCPLLLSRKEKSDFLNGVRCAT